MRKRNVITQDAVPTVCDGHIARPNNRKQIDWWLLYFFPHFVSLFLITMSIHPSISLFLSLFVYYIFGSASVSIISSEFYSCWNFCVHKFQSLHIRSISVEGGMCCCQTTTGNVYIVVDIIFRRERDFVGGLICLGCCRPLYIVLYIPSPQQQHGGIREEKNN
jgi:hypothetical protein